jgi:hypothetical protein
MKGRKLRLYEENKGITDIAGKGVDGNATGSALISYQYFQPFAGMCCLINPTK